MVAVGAVDKGVGTSSTQGEQRSSSRIATTRRILSRSSGIVSPSAPVRYRRVKHRRVSGRPVLEFEPEGEACHSVLLGSRLGTERAWIEPTAAQVRNPRRRESELC
jgi:hypothetical protein